MFDRPVHRLVAEVLAAFDPEVLFELGCAFADGTRLALELSEFRESRDEI